MKIVVLLALVGLASCHITFLGGERAQSVEIEYSYDDEYGREVEVEVKSDRLPETWRPSLRKVFTPVAPAPAPIPVAAPVVQYVNRDVLQHRPEVRTQFVAVEAPRPVFTQVVQRAQVAVARPTAPLAAPVPVASQYFRREYRPAPNIVYVRSEAPQPATTQYVAYEPVAPPPRPRVVTQYVRAEPAPVARPVISRTSFVKADYNAPVAFQPVRRVIPAVAPVRVAHSQPHFRNSLVPVRSQILRLSDDDDSGEK